MISQRGGQVSDFDKYESLQATNNPSIEATNMGNFANHEIINLLSRLATPEQGSRSANFKKSKEIAPVKNDLPKCAIINLRESSISPPLLP
jgi:hypothetical protein